MKSACLLTSIEVERISCIRSIGLLEIFKYLAPIQEDSFLSQSLIDRQFAPECRIRPRNDSIDICHPSSNHASFNFNKTGVHVDQFRPFMTWTVGSTNYPVLLILYDSPIKERNLVRLYGSSAQYHVGHDYQSNSIAEIYNRSQS
jgi:hypothetical protein